MSRAKEPRWKLIGFDTFSSEWYPLGSYPTEVAVHTAAKRRLEKLEETQPSEHSGGQGLGGIQDQVYIERPDGTRYRFLVPVRPTEQRKRSRGFTLIELLIVAAIIGIIAAIAIPMLLQVTMAKTPQEAYLKCAPQPRGGGVWYFTCGAQNFSLALGKFRLDHPELRVISVAPASNETGQYGATVVTEPTGERPLAEAK